MLFEKDVETLVIDFIRREAGNFKSDVAISSLIEEVFDLIVPPGTICQIRKRNKILSGQVAKNEKERKIAIDTWNKTKCVKSVSSILGISLGAAKSKLRHLHGKHLIEAGELVVTLKNKKREKKLTRRERWNEFRRTQADLTIVSHENINLMRQRKMDRVAYLCDMRTL